jgi:uncharacterized protein
MSEENPVKQVDFEHAKAYVLARLASELPPTMYYHSLAHTKDEVVPALERLAQIERVSGDELILLKTAAYFHDIGFIEQSINHEDVSVRIAESVLPDFGYSPEQIAIIKSMILATKLPQSPHTLPEKIIADEDLDVLGRDDYMSRNQALRDELAAHGRFMNDEQWYSSQLKFLQSHQYFTQAARNLREEKKQQNTIELVDLLAHT